MKPPSPREERNASRPYRLEEAFVRWNTDDAKSFRRDWPEFVVVDEGLDRLFRWSPQEDVFRWSVPLDGKCRTLQQAGPGRVIGAAERGFFEAELSDGTVTRHRLEESGEVLSASRLADGRVLLAGLNLQGERGVCFVEYGPELRPLRRCCLPGDYVRGSAATEDDTLLYTNNDRVIECTWEGRRLRAFAAQGFLHAWKARRLPGGHTLITAGYGAFAVEFDADAKEVRRWECPPWARSRVRPFFFGDFALLEDGTLIVCNWLGHGPGLGGSGCAFLEFAPDGSLASAWQDADRTSSVQTFALLDRIRT